MKKFIRNALIIIIFVVIASVSLAYTENFIVALILFFIYAFIIFLLTIETMVRSLNIAKPHKRLKNSSNLKKMVSPEFKELYYYIERNYAANMERRRKKVVLCIIFSIIFCTFILIGVMVYKANTMLMLGPIILFYISYELYKKNNSEYVNEFKNNVIRNFIFNINNNLRYNSEGNLNMLKCYQKLDFYNGDSNALENDDYIYGMVDDVNINLCNIILENVNSLDELNFITYEGIYSLNRINVNIKKEIKIVKNKAEKDKEKLVKLDVVEFEKYFDVFCDEKILAMQVLTHEVMEQLIDFHKKYNIDFEIILKNKSLNIRFDIGSMFEPCILKKSYNMQQLALYYNIIKFVVDVSKEFNKTITSIDI